MTTRREGDIRTSQDGTVVQDSRFLNSRAWLTRWSDRRFSQSLAQMAHDTARPDDHQAAGLALRTLAWHCKWLGEFDASETHCTHARQRLDPATDQEALADVMSILGVIHYSRGRRDLAIDATEQGLALIEGRDATVTRIDLLTTKSTILRYNGRFREACDMLQSARNMSSGCERARVDHNMARCLDHEGKIVEASALALQSVVGARRHDNRVILPYALEILGTTLLRLGKPIEARRYLNEGLVHAREYGDRRAECQLLEQIGLVLHSQDMLDDALLVLQEGLATAEALNYPIWQKRFLRHSMSIHESRHDQTEALATCRRLLDLLDAERA